MAEIAALVAEKVALAAALTAAKARAPSGGGSESSRPQRTEAARDIAREALRALQALEDTAAWGELLGVDAAEGNPAAVQATVGHVSAIASRERGSAAMRIRQPNGATVSGSGSPRLSVSPRTLCVVFDSPLREKVLMIQRARAKGPQLAGMSNLLGGHVEHGEDVLSSAIREAAEESGLPESALSKRARLAGVVHVVDFFGAQVMML